MRLSVLIIGLAAVLDFAPGALAQTPGGPAPDQSGAGGQPNLGGTPQSSDKPSDQGPPSIQSSLGPYGDPAGIRAALGKQGVTYSLTYIGEMLGNVSGGIRTGAIQEGRLDAQVTVDLKTAAGLDGATLHANAYRIYGDGLSRNNIDNLSVVSGIEARASTRLYEAWFEQSFLDSKLSLRLGQLGADTEFLVTQYGAVFVNSTFGWPTITTYDLPSGGPAYPLAAPAARLKLAPDKHWSLLTGVFDGDPAGPANASSATDPQRRDPHGTNFRVTDAPLVIAEAAYSYGDKNSAILPGIVKLGGWRHFGRFDSEISVDNALSLVSNGPQTTPGLNGNDGIYGMIDQMVYRLPGTEDGALGVFARLSGSPADRNHVSFYADAGLNGKGLVPGRPDDTAGLSYAYTQISSAARAADFTLRGRLQAPYPIRSNEMLVEATYQAQVVPGFTLQPDFQYVFRPGGNIPDPKSKSFAPIKDAAVFGVRATIQY